MVLLGVLAIRLQSLKKVLQWDGESMEFTNITPTDELVITSESSFSVIDGHPHFNNKSVRLNALEESKEYIKHTYREGWSLPNLPK